MQDTTALFGKITGHGSQVTSLRSNIIFWGLSILIINVRYFATFRLLRMAAGYLPVMQVPKDSLDCFDVIFLGKDTVLFAGRIQAIPASSRHRWRHALIQVCDIVITFQEMIRP